MKVNEIKSIHFEIRGRYKIIHFGTRKGTKFKILKFFKTKKDKFWKYIKTVISKTNKLYKFWKWNKDENTG